MTENIMNNSLLLNPFLQTRRIFSIWTTTNAGKGVCMENTHTFSSGGETPGVKGKWCKLYVWNVLLGKNSAGRLPGHYLSHT